MTATKEKQLKSCLRTPKDDVVEKIKMNKPNRRRDTWKDDNREQVGVGVAAVEKTECNAFGRGLKSTDSAYFWSEGRARGETLS